MKFIVKYLPDQKGVLLTKISDDENDIDRMEIVFRDGDTVETGHNDYPLLTIDNINYHKEQL